METVDEVLKACRVEGNNVFLPEGQLERKLYLAVNQKLELIGGTWSKKERAHVFAKDPTELLGQVANGEKRNLKKEMQFFPTPAHLADRMVELAEISEDGSDSILEPSAGQGALITAIQRRHPGQEVWYYELNDINCQILKAIAHAKFIGNDFLTHEAPFKFDVIIANPPFSKNQDIYHIGKMWELLQPGGKLVTIASNHWHTSNNVKEKTFKNWLEMQGATIMDVPGKTFKESGTDIATSLIVLDKKLR